MRSENTLVGTPLYMAPETFLRLEYSSASDLWAIGVVVCDLHSHLLPWLVNENMTPEEIGQVIALQEPVKPSGMADAV